MATECDRSLLYWIADSWGAVAQDDDMTVWQSVSHASEKEAQDAANKRCTDGSKKGGCKALSSFQNACWAVATGQKSKSEWAQGWAYDGTLQTAKDESLKNCGNEGGKNCYLVMHICSDGTNEWHNSN